MASILPFQASPCLCSSSKSRHRQSYPGRVHTSLGEVDSSAVLSVDLDVNGRYVLKEKEKIESSVDVGNGYLESKVGVEKRKGEKLVLDSEKLQPLWEDDFGTASMKDYLSTAKDLIKSDGGPPRWFCPVEAP